MAPGTQRVDLGPESDWTTPSVILLCVCGGMQTTTGLVGTPGERSRQGAEPNAAGEGWWRPKRFLESYILSGAKEPLVEQRVRLSCACYSYPAVSKYGFIPTV